MIRFARREQQAAGPVGFLPRVAPLVVLLVLALAMMIGGAIWARRDAPPAARAPTTDFVTTAAPAGAAGDQQAESVEKEAPPLEGVELERLSEFRDHSRAMAPGPYYYLLNLARRNPAMRMEAEARRDVSYLQLLDDPERYRGQLLFIEGRLRRLLEHRATANPYEITTQYEGWLFGDEPGGPRYCVILADRPANVPLTADMNEPVSVAGYFLGWWAHSTLESERTKSPVIMAHRFVVRPTPDLRPDARWTGTYGLAAGVLVLAGLLAAFYWSVFQRGGRASRTAEGNAGAVLFTGPAASDESSGADLPPDSRAEDNPPSSNHETGMS